MYRMIFMALTTALALPASAADWIKTSTAEAAAAFVDADSLKFSGDRRLFWSKLVLAEPRAMSDGSLLQTLEAHVEADCEAETLALLEVILYKPSGKVWRHNKNPEEAKAVVRDSLEETQFRFVCQHETKHL